MHRVRNERTFFLFDKTLLITKKRGDHFVYKGNIPVTRPCPISAVFCPSQRIWAPLLVCFLGLSTTLLRSPSLLPQAVNLVLYCPFPLPLVLLPDADRKHQRLPVLHCHPLQAQQAAVQHPGEGSVGLRG